jgi:hypothetical protein
MLIETPQEQKFIYYVCDESGQTLYEYTNELDAREVANKHEGYSISRKQLLVED